MQSQLNKNLKQYALHWAKTLVRTDLIGVFAPGTQTLIKNNVYSSQLNSSNDKLATLLTLFLTQR